MSRANVEVERQQPQPPVSDLPNSLEEATSDRSGRALILVVERDPHIRELESYFLNEAGFAVEFAADGLAALARARALRPDIIITEVLVPKLDGLALCRTVKTDPALRHTVMLIFSILAVQSRAREAGADAFLMKPLAEKRLVDTVRQLLMLRKPPAQDGDVA
jgi:two-component system response regulator MprA